MRSCIGATILKFETNYAKDEEEYMKKAEEKYFKKYKKKEKIIKAISPHANYTVTNKAFEKVLQQSEKYDLLIHSHLHVTSQEVLEEINSTSLELRPLERYKRLGLLGPKFIAAHML